MGYSHYFNNVTASDEQWGRFTGFAAAIVNDSKVPIDLKTDGGFICINGVAEEDQHEDLYIIKEGGGSSQFCKTARKPYDAVVCAVLHMYEYICGEGVHVQSDGDLSDEGWTDAYTYILKKFGVEYLTGCYYRRRSAARKYTGTSTYTLDENDDCLLFNLPTEVVDDETKEFIPQDEEIPEEVHDQVILGEMVEMGFHDTVKVNEEWTALKVFGGWIYNNGNTSVFVSGDNRSIPSFE